MKAKCLRNYKKLSAEKLAERAQHVHDTFPYPTPLPPALRTKADFAADITDFNTAMAKAVNGSTGDTADKANLRAIIEADLDAYADYTDVQADGDPAIIISYGFEPSDTSHSKIVLTVTTIKSVDNSVSGKLKLAVQPVAGAFGYEVELTTPANVKTVVGGFSDSRGILVEGLVPGTLYGLRVRATGGHSSRADWSLPVSIMCT